MPSADTIVERAGVAGIPLDYTVPTGNQIVPRALTVSFDGSAAAGSYLPTIEVLAQNGAVVARCPVGLTVAAGASADVTWFPGVTGPAAASQSGTIPGLIENVQLGGNVTITSTNQLAPDAVLTGAAHAYDGITTIRVDVDLLAQLDMRSWAANAAGGFVIFDLWQDGAYLTGLFDFSVSGIIYVGTFFRSIYLTPAAGSHSFAINAWIGHGVGVGNPGTTVLATISVGDPVVASQFSLVQVNPVPA